MGENTVLVAGASGIVGYNAMTYFEKLPNWKAIGLSRRIPKNRTLSSSNYIPADLYKPESFQPFSDQLQEVTHVVFAAYQHRSNVSELVAPNLQLLENLVIVLERFCPRVERIILLQGLKAYGSHLGPFKTPAKETDPRHMPPNFYYNQEDLLKAHQDKVSWVIVRPSWVYGFAIGNPMNILMSLTVYASISKHLGLPLRFPGTKEAYTSLMDATDAQLLAKAIHWALVTPECANQIFNINNGDYFRWENIWGKIGEALDMDIAAPQYIPLSTFMRVKEPVWEDMVQKYGLKPYPFSEIASWEFMDSAFSHGYDSMLDTIKAREFGFTEFISTEKMFTKQISMLRQERYIP
ncbi:SDR family oxidoreductase [Alicyclobacillus dauci]|uniref:SDR family oxidoreductase n=1 Tax=Alicyclobacillus dauci TaxID=1475485 RepID=A0ABY6Z0B4_9BACL|nr:SDR family oxidoreductase [Alicyclobacillus dauci]WAH36190.1 SDR family oxidoreductase [Alicyclobacillus dauci]